MSDRVKGKMATKKCRICGDKFPTQHSTRVVCSIPCAIRLVERNNAKKEKRNQAEKRKVLREKKQALKGRRDWLADAQKAFNAWVRERDYGKPCISCGKPMNNDGLLTGSRVNAGHYRSVGACRELRFNPLNVNAQCAQCNKDLSGNVVEYRKGLIERYGIERVEWIEGPHPMTSYTIDDLKEIVRYYRAEARRLKRLREQGKRAA